jgi:undecaprenyl-diphosphatase
MLAAVVFYSILFLAVVVVPAGAILVVLLLLDHRHQVWRFMTRLSGAIGSKWVGAPVIERLSVRFPRAATFLNRRFDSQHAWGLPATIAGIGVLLGLWLFLGVLQDIAAKDPLVILDVRLHNIIPLFRTPGMTWLMMLLTQLGSAAVLGTLCLGIALLALSWKRPRLAGAFLLAAVASGLSSLLLKWLIGHARPIGALIHADTTSFPSGHLLGATVIYGLLATIVLQSRARLALRVVGTTCLLLTIVGVGISRLYLGIHWPSDLLGSLGIALVLIAAILFLLQFNRPLERLDGFRLPFDAGAARGAGIAIILIAFGVAAFLAPRTEQLAIDPPPPQHPIDLEGIQRALADLPQFSENLVGGKMEPISLIFIGLEGGLERIFAEAGWSRADLPTPPRVFQEILAVLGNRPDPSAPATPAFFADWPQTITFERSDASHPDISYRHHTRVWQTPYCVAPDCRPLWVATASFDVGIEISPRVHLPTHRIDPAIDHERALIVDELTNAGARHVADVSVTPAVRGSNAAGDPFWTDGRAAIVEMPR